MKTTLTRLFTVMMLIMVSMGAKADVKVLYGESGNDTFMGGKISATQEVQKDGQVAVTFTIKPDNGYTFTYTKTSLVIVSVYDPSSKSSTRADEIKVSEPLWPKGTEGTISYPNYGEYTVTVDPNLGVWVQKVEFQKKREGEKGTPGVDIPLGTDHSGYYYIINFTLEGNSTRYNASEPQNGYYLCPAAPPANPAANYNYDAVYYDGTSKQKPYLTTYKKGRVNDAVWKIEYAETDNTDNDNPIDYYYIRYCADNNKYLTHNTSRTTTPNRLTVHLQTEKDGNNSMFCFETGRDDASSFFIRSRQVSSGDRHLNPPQQNYNEYYGTGGKKTAKINNVTIDVGGMIGYYTSTKSTPDDQASQWYLEKAAPVVTYNSSNLIEISYIEEGATIYYSYGEESTPSESTFNYSTPFDPPAGTTTIKAIAIKDGKESGIATFTPSFFLGSTHKYAIQSVACQFYYLIPNLKTTAADYPKNISTLNVPCSTMAWNFEDAADNDGQYYYIKNSQGGYLYYPTTDNTDKYIFLQQDKDTNDDGYKFSITSHASGGFNVIPKNQTIPINKTSVGSSGTEMLRAVKLAGNKDNATSRWNIIQYDNTTGIPQWTDKPFDESTDNVTNYYNIVSVSQTTKPIILNNSGNVKSETLPPSDYDERKAMWVIKKVGSDADGLLDYYTFQNAYTGDLLYYNGNGKNYNGNVLQLGQPTTEGADATWSHFVVVQTINNGYNIIPRPIVDNTKAINTTSNNEGFNCINRRGGDDVLGTYYDDGDGSRWTFAEQTNVKCMNPVFTEETDGSITITSVTNAAVIRYTDNGNNPDANSGVYTTKSNTSSQRVIKAIAIIGTDANTASDIVTLLNKPDINITLTEGGNTVTDETYTYDGTAKEPVVSEVSIGEAPNKTSATAGTDYETVESTDYSDNTNASTDAVKAKVTLRDKASNIFVWHAEKEFKINPKEVGLTWNPDDSGQTTFTYSGLAQAPTVTATGVVGTDVCTVTVTVTADEGWSLKGGEAVNYGNYTATASPLENKNYKLPDAKTRAFTITRAPVTVTADNKTKGYGDPEPEWTATVTGMVNNENPNLITYTVSCDHGDENGTYDIIPSGAAEQGNYTVTYVKGTLTINAIKPLNKDDAGTPADGITIDVTYNGTAYQVVVKHRKVENDYVLVQGNDKDYTWSVASNTDPNHPEYDVVTVTGHGNYTGDAKAIYIRLTFYDTTPNNDTDGPETAAAYYATQNLQLSGGIEAWYVTNLENNTLTFEKVKVVEGENEISYLPENQPVLLFGDPSSTGFMLKPYTGTIMEIPATGEGSNILKLVTENAGKAVNLGEVYVFSKGEFVLTMAGTLTKGKVYLDNPSYNSSSLSRGTLSASRGGTTGINDVRLSKTNDQFNNVWYALDGQKFNKKPTRKGIYLQNGKKVVIK